MAHFTVGEVAIYWRPTSACHRMECTIMDGLKDRMWACPTTGETGKAAAYEIEFAGLLGPWVAEPCELRKRRPPQDWVKLCHLTDIPREVEHA